MIKNDLQKLAKWLKPGFEQTLCWNKYFTKNINKATKANKEKWWKHWLHSEL